MRVHTTDYHTSGEPFRIVTAVVPEVDGTAFRTGTHEFTLDPRDPLGSGFLLR